jgi:phytoene dehydrogenase-like protein
MKDSLMNKKIVIIGGGIAGLSAGIYSRLNGFETEILEMHSISGGQCTAWYRKGYRFDYCLRWLVGTRVGPFHDIWRETDAINDNVKIINPEIHTKMFSEDGTEFNLLTNLEKWGEYLLEIAPEDKKSIRKMCRDMRKPSSVRPFSDAPHSRTLKENLGQLFRNLPVIILFMKYGRKTCKEYFEKLDFKNEKLKFFFYNLYATRDYSALAFIMMFAWFNQENAGYPIGGSLPLAERMTEKFRGLGGVLSTGKKAEKIIVENDIATGVKVSDNNDIKADYVISAADGHSTIYEMLEGKYLDDKITCAYESWDLFNPIVQVSFGINKEIITDYAVQSWLVKSIKIGITKLDHGYSIMNYYFDPTMAPPGKTVIVMRFVSPWELWKDLEGASYKNEKIQIAQEASLVLEKHFPGITENIEVIDVATPKTGVRHTGVWKGAYEGFLPTSRNLNANLNQTLPGLKRFYMAGQWLFPGGGLPPAGQSGKWAIQMICKKEKKKFLTC